MPTFEDEMRAAFAEGNSAPAITPALPEVNVAPINVASMPARKPALGTLIRNEKGEITGMVWEPLASVTRGNDGEIESYVPQRASQ